MVVCVHGYTYPWLSTFPVVCVIYKGCNNTTTVSYYSKLKVINSVHNNYSIEVAILLRHSVSGNNYKLPLEDLEDKVSQYCT